MWAIGSAVREIPPRPGGELIHKRKESKRVSPQPLPCPPNFGGVSPRITLTERQNKHAAEVAKIPSRIVIHRQRNVNTLALDATFL